MFVADAGVAFWVVGLLLVGVLGFAVVLISLIFKFIAWILRSLFKIFTPRRSAQQPVDSYARRNICPRRGCGHSNGPTALYCGRCGRPLR